jgi:hypothetical protein
MAEDKEAQSKGDPRARIVDALLALAAEKRFEEIAIAEIAGRAQASFADSPTSATRSPPRARFLRASRGASTVRRCRLAAPISTPASATGCSTP